MNLKIDEWVNPTKDTGPELKRPVTTNSMDLARQYTSFSGVDQRVRIDGKTEGTIQAISFSRFKIDGVWHVAGTIIRLVLQEGCGLLPEKFDELEVVAANEYGAVTMIFGLKDVEIVTCSSGVSVDDMVIEETYNYVAKEFIPGRTIRSVDFVNARTSRTVHTKHVAIVTDEEKKALLTQALKITETEPSDFMTELTVVLDRYKVQLL
jgi:hypothetical protein